MTTYRELSALASLVLLAAIAAGCAGEAATFHKDFGGPGPGDVYREYTYGRRFGQVDPEATNPGAMTMMAMNRPTTHSTVSPPS